MGLGLELGVGSGLGLGLGLASRRLGRAHVPGGQPARPKRLAEAVRRLGRPEACSGAASRHRRASWLKAEQPCFRHSSPAVGRRPAWVEVVDSGEAPTVTPPPSAAAACVVDVTHVPAACLG